MNARKVAIDPESEEHFCCRCEVALYLIEGFEWPTQKSMHFCYACAIEEIAHLRKKVKNLQNSRR